MVATLATSQINSHFFFVNFFMEFRTLTRKKNKNPGESNKELFGIFKKKDNRHILRIKKSRNRQI